MTSRAARLAWVLCVAALALVLSGPVLLVVARGREAVIFSAAFGAVQATSTVIGGVVAARLPRNPVGWILLALGVGLGVSTSASAYGALGVLSEHGPLPGDEIAGWLGEWTFVPAVYGCVVALLYLFPDGHFLTRRWKVLGCATAVLVVCAMTVDALLPGPLEDLSDVDNPVGVTGGLADVVTTAQKVTDPAALPGLLLAAAALVVRFRRSHGIERQQLKWISVAFVAVGVGLALTASTLEVLGSWTFIIAMFALAAVPLAIGAAMLRYRLYEIDVVINRALVYGTLTAAVGGFYLGSILHLHLALRPFTEGSSLAIAASTLAAAGLFRVAQARVQDAVDRRFFRAKYDAGQTLDRFGSKVRGQVDLADVGADLLAAAGSTLQPAHASLWLRTPESHR